MRHARVLFALLAVFATLSPLAGADSKSGSTYGANGGFAYAGVWDVYTFDKVGGTSAATIALSWDASLFPGADYDLRLYRPGSLDDGVLRNSELVTANETRSFTVRDTAITRTLAEGRYVVAVVPFQTQGERYTLSAEPGWLRFEGRAPGAACWSALRCPLE